MSTTATKKGGRTGNGKPGGSVQEILYDGTTGDPTVVAFDPGGTTGWAVFCVHPDALTSHEFRVMDNVVYWVAWEFFGTEFDQVDQMVELCEQWPGAAIVTEDFILQQFRQDRTLLAPVRLNAAMRYGLGRGRAVHLQMPKLAMDTVTDERLRAMGYWNVTAGKPHARDAIRHAVTLLKRIKEQPKLREKIFPALKG